MMDVLSGHKPPPSHVDFSTALAIRFLVRGLVSRFTWNFDGTLNSVAVAKDADTLVWRPVADSYLAAHAWLDRYVAGKEVLS